MSALRRGYRRCVEVKDLVLFDEYLDPSHAPRQNAGSGSGRQNTSDPSFDARQSVGSSSGRQNTSDPSLDARQSVGSIPG
jgi:hypothetical protein